ncbi:MAG: sugar phosphate isomerase/epimerase family protein [Acetivibrionales bacterium]|jgi:sugar phosphate isomerase/epimerase
MKLSVAIADTNAAANAFVVWRGFEESIVKAKEYGYHGVELALRKANEINVSRLSKMLEQNNMEVSAISTGQVFASLNQYLTNPDETQRLEAVKTITDLAILSKDFGKMVNIGRARGFYADDVEPSVIEDLFIDSLKRIVEVAAKHDVVVVIEPVNRYEINFINNVEQCAQLLDRVDFYRKNIGIMPDVFHMNIEDAHIGESLEKHADLIRYIHLADSNRYAPGNGHLDFDEVFSSLLKMKYNDWVSVEILPQPTPDIAALKAAEYLLPRIAEHNRKIKELID